MSFISQRINVTHHIVCDGHVSFWHQKFETPHRNGKILPLYLLTLNQTRLKELGGIVGYSCPSSIRPLIQANEIFIMSIQKVRWQSTTQALSIVVWKELNRKALNTLNVMTVTSQSFKNMNARL